MVENAGTSHSMPSKIQTDMRRVVEPLTPQRTQKIIDYILDHLHDDKVALRQCSIVCKAWEPACTSHLFSTLSWPPCGHWWETYNDPRPCGGDSWCICHAAVGTFERCCELLSSSPRISRAVRRLRLTPWRSTDKPGISGGSQVIAQATFVHMMDLLENLVSLELYDCKLKSGTSFVAGTCTITELSLISRYAPKIGRAHV